MILVVPLCGSVDSVGIVTKFVVCRCTEIEELDKKIDEFFMKDSLVKQHIFSTITDRLLLRVQKLDNASKIWEEIRSIHEGKSDLVQIDLHCRLHETRCEEGGDVKAHLGELLRLRELLASMGASLDDKDFSAIIMGSLPESYRPILSSMNAAARVSQKTLSPDEIMGVISEEYEHRVIANPTTSKKGGNTALTAGAKPDRSKSRNSGGNSNVTCYNCNNVGHIKADCWSKGGGKEGQRPQRRGKRNGNSQRPAANAATQSPSTTTTVENYAFATSDLHQEIGELLV